MLKKKIIMKVKFLFYKLVDIYNFLLSCFKKSIEKRINLFSKLFYEFYENKDNYFLNLIGYNNTIFIRFLKIFSLYFFFKFLFDLIYLILWIFLEFYLIFIEVIFDLLLYFRHFLNYFKKYSNIFVKIDNKYYKIVY